MNALLLCEIFCVARQMRSRKNQDDDDLDFDSCVVEALASGARSVDRRVRFRRGWSDLSSHVSGTKTYEVPPRLRCLP